MDFPKIAAAATTSDQHRAHVPQRRPCRPRNIDALRKLCIFGNAEQWAWAQKAADDIWAGRNGWMSGQMKLVDLEVVLHHQTDRAVLVSLDGDRTKAKWLPKSAIELERMPDSTHYTLTLPEQLAIDKELV